MGALGDRIASSSSKQRGAASRFLKVRDVVGFGVQEVEHIDRQPPIVPNIAALKVHDGCQMVAKEERVVDCQ
jgi:hypothetical protein